MKNPLTNWVIYKNLIKIYPLHLQAEWDMSKFICPLKSRKQVCRRIFIMLDLEYDWFKKQKFSSTDLIIMHHPIIFSKTPTDLLMLRELKKSGTPLLFFHTNFDFNPIGMNFQMGQIFNSSKIIDYQEHGYFVQLQKRLTVKEIATEIDQKYQCTQLIYDQKFANQKIQNLQILLGSAASEIDFINKNRNQTKVELFITGDMKWHDWQKARHTNLAVIDCHHSTEKLFINVIYQILKDVVKPTAQIIKVKSSLQLVYQK
ncbi:putative NIF3 family GTP cyclohydrolase 1 type 2 [Mycoplasmoides fastidiosum]|uniref:GTP cyclohydrolase 1 type 2 homolog n=1 Tax=Mycoplasmoides fastidiosum TaxID=92758 RepID=A0ABU0LZS2_9BACT|nr:Nif3-like dinuclear metal center hexameric protein [Mycoplasmoides fastidiosum]MDQ0514187.1 putative NIF3 family GTP cyclohydrolase 1 type 2 [Mycoplasmoides fastidiosum]UUD37401.1 Nif3-like dinuclear metal center hexameric protein [Mycoplasmoides fastidiosum]